MKRARLILCTAGVRKHSTLAALLDDFELVYPPPRRPEADDCVLAWGQRPSALKAQRYAHRHGLQVRYIEDGFLRSVGLGPDDPPLSIVMDDQALYLDAGQATRLEAMIKRQLNASEARRATALIHAWRDGMVSKYNHSRDDACPGLEPGFVLVVDQTFGDASVSAGDAAPEDFLRMLDAALAEHPTRTIVVKVHPDVVAGRKRGHFNLDQLRAEPRVVLLDRDVHPASLLAKAHAVYTVTSQLGFEGLLWEKPVRTFGMPFYAGWGLTSDAKPAPARRQTVSLLQLAHAVLIDYCRYVDPETGQRCDAEVVLAWLALQRRMRQRFPEQITAIGFSGWKHGYVREFFNGSRVKFSWFPRRVLHHDGLATWGCKRDSVLSQRSPAKPVIRVEDGFLRSVGLGADLVRPVSWVQDDVGIYYDATRPSRLERILAETDFTDELLARARALREAICAAGITKYNLSTQRDWTRPSQTARVLLVIGQVETDASIRFGAHGVRRNIDLLRSVRQSNPDDYLLYKPHPDVLAGLRESGDGEKEALQWCDEIVDNVSIERLLSRVDEVHTLTSLTGFEAILREVPVVTYGQPFYAGWGLSIDRGLTDPVRARRQRRLSVDQLVAGALILYPTYVSRTTKRFTTPERVLAELVSWRKQPSRIGWRHYIAKIFREK
ncbi:capsular polysaccharide biosynthesis protein [Bordetella sp. 02P26C-1]|nr:capsular polysaccharide biosynthesis protein [Bordetella sp. 02P26C-1]MVW80532.1 capsular polysaccharide biosynthesis protein [Bordetella sp. 02P26C-1]